MSRLKELRLHGFKSFAEPTHFVFQPGVTAVIGPNGSGKSNMADAIRWVLGEQSNRSLRTRRSDDVIFAGSESRKPIGLADVTLTLDNHDRWLPIDFEEVTITRRAYRSGDPEYLINGARARLRDVVELLAAGRLGANELVVVGQGTVDAALSLRPEERRQLFEEAAGVKSLQVRRNESLARLSKARDNLTRISDLVRELRPQVRRLALQAEHQEAHDRLGRRVRALIDEHHHRRAQFLQAGLGEARRRAAAVAADLAAEREAQVVGREAVEEAEARYWAAEAASRAASAAWEAAREAVIRAEGRLESAEQRAHELEAEAAALVSEMEFADATANEAAPAGSEVKGDVEPAAERRRADAEVAEAAWRDAVERARAADAGLMAAEEALAVARAAMADGLARASRWNEVAAAGAARRELLETDLAALEVELAAAAEAHAALGLTATEAAKGLAAAESRAADANRERDAAMGDATRSAAAIAELEERLAAAERELAGLEADGAGAPDAAERLRARGFAALPDSWRQLPDGIERAVLAALGDVERTFWWRTDADPSVQDASGAVRLVRGNAGAPSGRDAAMTAVRATDTLADRVGDPAAPEILHRTVVAADLASLLAGWEDLPDGWAAVTPEGDLADARGVLTLRGRADDGAGPRSRAEQAAAVRRRRAEITRELATARRRGQETAQALTRLSGVADAAQAALDAARVTRRRADDEVAAVAAGRERLALRQAALASDLSSLPESGAPPPPVTGADDIAALASTAQAARALRDQAAADREAARAAWTAAVAAADAQDAAAADARSAWARADERRRRAEEIHRRLSAERSGIVESTRLAGEALAEARAAEASAAAQRQAAEDTRESVRQALLDAERRLGGGAGRLAELDAAENQVVAESSRLEEALVGLDRERELSLAGLPELADAADAGPDPALGGEDAETAPSDLADDDLAEELKRTRRTLAQIGSVNPFAIEEHRELSARLGELSTQETDLRSATESTESLIAELDAQISSQFQSAFAAIGQRFDEYCQLLFAGGSASLELSEDPDSEAPGGIEIAVRPPGKRLQRLAMLSGGERALAGVALLFAMLTVNPVPFCVLDEVDAALDEANIGRFADALRRLAETIDFVVITHNRATIETADTIYGVTMTDAAVSRVLSLRLADLPVLEPV